MNIMIRFNKILIMAVFGFHLVNSHNGLNNSNSFAKGCFGIAAGTALLGAAALAASYFSQPTDQQQYESTVDLYNQLRIKYSWALDSFVDCFEIGNLSFYEKQRVLKTCNEEFLNNIGWIIWTNGIPIASLPEKISEEAYHFDSCLHDLTNRVNTLKLKQYPSYFEINLINEMDSFLSSVSYSGELFVFFAEYCKKYASYFVLSDAGWGLYAQYETELTMIDRYRNDIHQLMVVLHDIIVNKHNAHCSGSDCRYPYIRYVELLDSGLTKLETLRNKFAFCYPVRVGWIDSVLIPQLRWLRVTLDPYYQSELLYQRRIQLDEEILSLRHEKALHDVANLECARAELDYEYNNAVRHLVIQIH